MAEENKRGGVRARPDPMAIATKGRVTTYEARDLPGINITPRLKGRIKARAR